MLFSATEEYLLKYADRKKEKLVKVDVRIKKYQDRRDCVCL